MLLLYDTPWWRASNITGITQSFVGPVIVTRDSSVDDRKQFSLTCFIVAQPGRDWPKLPKIKRERVVLNQIKHALGPFVDEVPDPIKAVAYDWIQEQWSQGCPCPAMPPGVMTSFGHELRTTHGKVHFIGTETSFEWKGYMEGAARSGERGAKEVIQYFNSAKL